ncbi:PSD1 domain-containing protein [bacterium AH-315-P07]|nr:PSD1 domain-containing protein [bacterium AH-315-P07]
MRISPVIIVVWISIIIVAPARAVDPVSFQDEIHPILAERCFKCHGGKKRKGGFSMNSREELLEGGEFGPAVALGKGSESLMLELLTSDDDEEWMPPKGDRLSGDQIDSIRRWIDEDLNWDMDISPESTWEAPLHLASVDVPSRKGMLRSKNPIDRILSAYFKSNKIKSPGLVSDRQFVRRVYMDILGMLPSPETVDAYAADRKKGKQERLVDRVLADDRSYAEHWMTFWNDALRNDHKGTGYIDGGRKKITNWLYRSLYTNKPFDQFVRELISPKGSSEGFIKGIKWRGAQTANQQVELQAARSVSQVFLGVNMKCASCHDSFVNRWKLSDAYGLANAFSEKPMALYRCDVATGETAKTQFLWPELGAIDAGASLEDRRKQTAALVTSPDNGWFSRTIVNRLWKSMMGRGLVEPLDSMDAEPWNPDLLDMLAADFVAQGYDIRATLKQIALSKTYQLNSDVREPSEGSFIFTGPIPRRLTVEQLYDAMGCVTGVWQAKAEMNPKDDPDSISQGTTRAWRATADPMMRALGRPNREQVMLARETDYTRLHALELTNGATLAAYLTRSSEALLTQGAAKTETLFVRALGRPLNPREQALVETYGSTLTTPEDVQDVLWLLFNHPEFQLVF